MYEKIFDRMLRTLMRQGNFRVTYPDGGTKSYGDGKGTVAATVAGSSSPAWRTWTVTCDGASPDASAWATHSGRVGAQAQ